MQAIPGLACPACRGDLKAEGERTLVCQACHATYPVFEGIPSFLPGSTVEQAPSLQLTVLIPALNEAANLADILPAMRRELESLEVTHELLVVDGGSTDGTQDVVAKNGATLLQQSMPGYGGALRTGFAQA